MTCYVRYTYQWESIGYFFNGNQGGIAEFSSLHGLIAMQGRFLSHKRRIQAWSYEVMQIKKNIMRWNSMRDNMQLLREKALAELDKADGLDK